MIPRVGSRYGNLSVSVTSASASVLLWALLLADERSLGSPPPEKGVALGLFSADPHYRYHSLVDEIVEAGATHVSITWVWWQSDLSAHDIRPIPGWTAAEHQIREVIEHARLRGLVVAAFPILRLMSRAQDEWRGRIRPLDEDGWWRRYEEFILDAARIASESGASSLTVGSELLSRESMRSRWLDLIDRVRMQAPSLRLAYSANWDHFEPVSFWDAVDIVGITAYWELTRSLKPSIEALDLAWRNLKPLVLDFSSRLGRRIVFTEVGYPSQEGGTAWPWDETRRERVDLENQRIAYEAFARAWSDTEAVEGVYFWNWFGFGGPQDDGYSPRHKPAQQVLEEWFRGSPR